jgi:hypothetical protein
MRLLRAALASACILGMAGGAVVSAQAQPVYPYYYHHWYHHHHWWYRHAWRWHHEHPYAYYSAPPGYYYR